MTSARTEPLRAESERAGDAPDPQVGIVGLGYVGLALAAAHVEAGVGVLGFDRDPERLASLEGGDSPVAHLDPARWDGSAGARSSGSGARLEVSADLERASAPDVLYLCLPTPLSADGEPDLGPLRTAAAALAGHLRAGQTVVNCSTTWPGATREVLAPLLAESGLELERELFIAHSPEREDPGRVSPTTAEIPRLVGGLGPQSLARAAAALGRVFHSVVEVESAETAEAAKLFENVFRAVNISAVTEFARVCRALGVDARAALDAAATKPFGFLPFAPGPGPGGHCIPIDPHYLAYVARRAGEPAALVELAASINAGQPAWVAERVVEALGRAGRPLAGARVLVLGVAYKPDVDDCRESPALPILEALRVRGVAVEYWDPHVPALDALGEACPEGLRGLSSQSATPERLAGSDAVLLLTPHRELDLDAVAEHSELLVDTRGALGGRRGGSPGYVGL